MRRLLIVTALLALAGTAQAQAPAAGAEPFSAERMWSLQRLGDPVLTPDGAGAIVSVARIDVAANKRVADLWLYPTNGEAPRQLTTDPANEEEPRVSPDGRLLAFVAKRDADEADALYVMPLAGGEARRIAHVATGVGQIRWLGDSRRIAFVSRVWPGLDGWAAQAARLKARTDSKMTARAWDATPVVYWDAFVDDRQNHLYLADTAGGEPVPVTYGSGRGLSVRKPGPFPYDVAPDGSEIAFMVESGASGVDGNADIFAMPLTGGTAVNLTPASAAPDAEPKYSPDGRTLAWQQQRDARFYADRWRLMLRDRASGRTRGLTEAWDRSAEGIVWAPDSRALYGVIHDTRYQRLYRFDVAGGAPRRLTDGDDVTKLSVAGSGRGGPVLVANRESFQGPPELVRVDERTGRLTPLSHLNDAALAASTLGRTESVTYKGSGDADIQMWVTYPPGFDPAKRYPLLLLIHGGPHSGISDAWTWRWNAQVFANWGYVVAWHNFHGSSGEGQAFLDSINPNWVDKPYEDTIKAADWFKAQPWIDDDRMIAAGGSYGGYMATVLLGREHPFKALVAHAAVFNMYTQLGGDHGTETPRFAEYWDRKAEFDRFSPHTYAANFKTPTLVIHGQQDQRVPVGNGFELFQTLQRRGVPSRFVYYPDENHWILKPQNSLNWYAEVKAWVERYAPPGAWPALQAEAVPVTTAPIQTAGARP